MTSRLPGRFETLSSLEGAAIDLVNYNLPDDYWSKYGTQMRGLTEAQLVGSREKIRPSR